MFKRVFLPLVLVLVLGAAAVYYWQGGFSKVPVSETTSVGKTIAGRYYQGPVRSAELNQLFEQAGSLAKSGELKGNLGGIYYNNPDEEMGIIKAFVGVVLSSPNQTLPANFELRQWPANQRVLQATVNAHHTLIPGKAYPALFNYAKEKNLSLKTLYFEEFESERRGTIQVALE